MWAVNILFMDAKKITLCALITAGAAALSFPMLRRTVDATFGPTDAEIIQRDNERFLLDKKISRSMYHLKERGIASYVTFLEATGIPRAYGDKFNGCPVMVHLVHYAEDTGQEKWNLLGETRNTGNMVDDGWCISVKLTIAQGEKARQDLEQFIDRYDQRK